MIRLTEDVMAEIQKRACPPAESFVFGLRLKMWPVFQKAMTEHVDALKKLAEGASTGYFSRAVATTDAVVSTVRPHSPTRRNMALTIFATDVQTLCRAVQLVRDSDGTRRGNHDLFKVGFPISLDLTWFLISRQLAASPARAGEAHNPPHRADQRLNSQGNGAVDSLRGPVAGLECMFIVHLTCMQTEAILERYKSHGTPQIATGGCVLGEPRRRVQTEDYGDKPAQVEAIIFALESTYY
jgi:hypothetical protein